MLQAAAALLSIESYKLNVYGDTLTFASNSLKSFRMKRSDCLERIAVWSPRLETLFLLGMYNLREVNVLSKSEHPLGAELTPDFELSVFEVDLRNSNRQAVQASSRSECSSGQELGRGGQLVGERGR
jgi:hypothetical protein